ncbi:hypothetical protein A2872_04565 [Candidatus Gottesmanbacteria bacterium RIFCSPHIGHO2_01_FULL_42_12]|uniref:Phosphoglycerate mutase n=1 Tax=Candidatus Gottesmanbacteria bacterium RIFCSPHIGHO2_01_FULL_42_12 TaxID=1798377 RepID=A0A1F5YZQ4_9BACT|nr:MAG: hypothetical protein A2872_04565 [Candidatus Gottesmanbacteria bacterium RIFCSPHIGHO2_01_FULL_42_12]
MTKFYLVRHGEKEKVAGDPGLTEVGKKQAMATGKYFKDKDIKTVYSSHLRRTTETAKHIASMQKLEVVVDPELRERANWGDLPGQTFEEFLEMWQLCDKNRDYVPPIGDSSRKAGERIEQYFRELHKKYSNEEIILVVHGGLIADFLFNIFPTDLLSKHNETFVDRASAMGITECSITVINFDGNKFKLEKLAYTSHLL